MSLTVLHKETLMDFKHFLPIGFTRRKISSKNDVHSSSCIQCNSVRYCNRECRDASWELYHEYECKLLKLIIMSGVGHIGHLALRIVMVRNGFFIHIKKCCFEGLPFCLSLLYKKPID